MEFQDQKDILTRRLALIAITPDYIGLCACDLAAGALGAACI
jgi:hypothetical protein